MKHIKSSLPTTLDPFHLLSLLLYGHRMCYHPPLSYSPVQKRQLCREVHVTIITQQLIAPISLCNWILYVLTRRTQSIRISKSSTTTTLNTCGHQGCVLSLLLFTLLTHDFAAKFKSHHFADVSTVASLIRKNDELAYREEVNHFKE